MIPFTFGTEFQNNVLTLMLNDLSFTDKCIGFIEEDHLHSDSHKWLFAQIKKKYQEEHTVPTMVDIEDNLKKSDKSKRRLYKNFAKSIMEAKPKSSDFIKNKLTEFAKKSAFVDLFQYGQTLYNEGETQDAYDYVLESINRLHNISFKDDQILSIQDFEKERKRSIMQRGLTVDRIPTLIPSLDRILMGGLSKFEGELGIMLAAPKVGKSIGLIHMGFACLTSLKGRVAHFILEGSTDMTMTRYQSRISGIPANRITKNDLSEEEEAKLELIGRRFMDRLDLIPMNSHWEYTTGDVEAKLIELEREGKGPDLVVVDYGDLLKPRTSQYEARHEQTAVFRDLKSIAMRMKKAMWTASQSQRPKDGPNKETVLRSRDIAEAFEKVRIADFIGTLNQTPLEKDQGVLRFLADVYRNNSSDAMIRLFCDFEKMVFSSRKLHDIMPHEIYQAAPWKMKRK